jgi:hypothetical protein
MKTKFLKIEIEEMKTNVKVLDTLVDFHIEKQLEAMRKRNEVALFFHKQRADELFAVISKTKGVTNA